MIIKKSVLVPHYVYTVFFPLLVFCSQDLSVFLCECSLGTREYLQNFYVVILRGMWKVLYADREFWIAIAFCTSPGNGGSCNSETLNGLNAGMATRREFVYLVNSSENHG